MEKQTALVTGGNSGIGFECARALATSGWDVVIASRNRSLSEKAIATINDEVGRPATNEMGLDLGSLDSIRQFAEKIQSQNLQLKALVCNAGVQVSGAKKLSTDGYEFTFAINHLGHFLLTNLLLEQLIANGPARIVIVASGVHDPNLFSGMPKAAITDIETLAESGGPRKDQFHGRLAYVNSKLCNLWFCYELARRLQQLTENRHAAATTVNGFDPGLVPDSGLVREYPAPFRLLWSSIMPSLAQILTHVIPMINPAVKSGAALANLITDPALEKTTAKYFPSHSRWKEAKSSDASYDMQMANKLWESSVRMTRMQPGDSPLV